MNHGTSTVVGIPLVGMTIWSGHRRMPFGSVELSLCANFGI